MDFTSLGSKFPDWSKSPTKRVLLRFTTPFPIYASQVSQVLQFLNVTPFSPHPPWMFCFWKLLNLSQGATNSSQNMDAMWVFGELQNGLIRRQNGRNVGHVGCIPLAFTALRLLVDVNPSLGVNIPETMVAIFEWKHHPDCWLHPNDVHILSSSIIIFRR